MITGVRRNLHHNNQKKVPQKPFRQKLTKLQYHPRLYRTSQLGGMPDAPKKSEAKLHSVLAIELSHNLVDLCMLTVQNHTAHLSILHSHPLEPNRRSQSLIRRRRLRNHRLRLHIEQNFALTHSNTMRAPDLAIRSRYRQDERTITTEKGHKSSQGLLLPPYFLQCRGVCHRVVLPIIGQSFENL